MQAREIVARWMLVLSASLLAADSATGQDVSLHQPRAFVAPAAATELPAQPLAGKAGEAPLALAPRGDRSLREAAPRQSGGGASAMTTVLGGLGVVLGLFFCLAWVMRRNLPPGLTRLPSEVVEQLGRAPLGGKQNLHLLRVGGKLVLVAVTPFGAETLTEITHPDEVERLVALCKAHSRHGPSAEFRAVLQQFEREPAGPGFLGHTDRSDAELAAAPRTRARGGYSA